MGVRETFVKVNTDATFRANFIKDPVGSLQGEGYALSDADQKQLMEMMEKMRKHLPDLGHLPSGYKDLIDEVAGGDPPPGGDMGMLII